MEEDGKATIAPVTFDAHIFEARETLTRFVGVSTESLVDAHRSACRAVKVPCIELRNRQVKPLIADLRKDNVVVGAVCIWMICGMFPPLLIRSLVESTHDALMISVIFCTLVMPIPLLIVPRLRTPAWAKRLMPVRSKEFRALLQEILAFNRWVENAKGTLTVIDDQTVIQLAETVTERQRELRTKADALVGELDRIRHHAESRLQLADLAADVDKAFPEQSYRETGDLAPHVAAIMVEERLAEEHQDILDEVDDRKTTVR